MIVLWFLFFIFSLCCTHIHYHNVVVWHLWRHLYYVDFSDHQRVCEDKVQGIKKNNQKDNEDGEKQTPENHTLASIFPAYDVSPQTEIISQKSPAGQPGIKQKLVQVYALKQL